MQKLFFLWTEMKILISEEEGVLKKKAVEVQWHKMDYRGTEKEVDFCESKTKLTCLSVTSGNNG